MGYKDRKINLDYNNDLIKMCEISSVNSHSNARSMALIASIMS